MGHSSLRLGSFSTWFIDAEQGKFMFFQITRVPKQVATFGETQAQILIYRVPN